MKVPYSWLVELLPELPMKINHDPHRLEPIMAMLGTGIEEIIEVPAPPPGVIFGVVLECEAIPETHLSKLQVDVGLEAKQQIVTGATNARAGLGVAVAPPGTTILGKQLEERAVQGFNSWGMLCSPKELGIGEYGGGILELPANDAKPGAALEGIWAKDFVFDIEVTPNRADALSVLGVARDIAAFLKLELKEPSKGLVSSADANFSVKLALDAKRDADRFVARMIKGSSVQPSPAWLQRRVTLAGMRSINNIVDASNYVMLEIGQPTAAYDARDIPNLELHIRDAKPGEQVLGLDGNEYTCDERDLLVATPINGQSVPVGIGGILGAKYSSINNGTTDVILEAAHWDAVRLRLTGRRLGLATDALYHFERGVDPNIGVWAADRFMEIVQATGGGEVVPGHADLGGAQERSEIEIHPIQVNSYLGTDYEYEDMKSALERLGFEVAEVPQSHIRLGGSSQVGFGLLIDQNAWSQKDVEEIKAMIKQTNDHIDQVHASLLEDVKESGQNHQVWQNTWLVKPPTWRVNMDIGEDLIEEIARMLGYDSIPNTLPNFHVNDLTRVASKPYDRTRELKSALVGLGFQEIVTYSFTNPDEMRVMHLPEPMLELRNAPSSERTHLRPCMIGSLLNAAKVNKNAGNVLLFDVGRVFPMVDLEEERLGALLMGDFAPKIWGDSVAGGFYTFKGLLEAMAAKLGDKLTVVPIEDHVPHKPECLHPGIAGAVLYNGSFVGIIGAIHPSVAAALELPSNLIIAEIRLPLPSRAWAFSDPSRQPAALRDLAIIADKSVPYSKLEAIAKQAAGEYLEHIAPFDIFEGEKIGAGKRSVALTMRWRAADRTLNDEEVGAAFQSVIAAMRAAGLEIRDS